jgi:hypothetical protein
VQDELKELEAQYLKASREHDIEQVQYLKASKEHDIEQVQYSIHHTPYTTQHTPH